MSSCVKTEASLVAMYPQHVTFPAEMEEAILDVVRERTAASGQWSIIHPFGWHRHRRSIVFQQTPPGDLPRRCNAERMLETAGTSRRPLPGPFLDFQRPLGVRGHNSAVRSWLSENSDRAWTPYTHREHESRPRAPPPVPNPIGVRQRISRIRTKSNSWQNWSTWLRTFRHVNKIIGHCQNQNCWHIY